MKCLNVTGSLIGRISAPLPFLTVPSQSYSTAKVVVTYGRAVWSLLRSDTSSSIVPVLGMLAYPQLIGAVLEGR